MHNFRFLQKFKDLLWFLWCDLGPKIFTICCPSAHLQGFTIFIFLANFLWAPHCPIETCRAHLCSVSADTPPPPPWWWFSDQSSGPQAMNLAPFHSPPTRVHVLTNGLTLKPLGPTWFSLPTLSHFSVSKQVPCAYLWAYSLFSGPIVLFPA